MRFIRCLIFLLFAAIASAQTAHWDPPAGTLGLNQTTELQLVFENCEPNETVTPPTVSGFQLQSAGGESRSMEIRNGHFTKTVAYTFQARATERGVVKIPAFAVATDKGTVNVPAVSYRVGDATVGQGNLSLSDVAHATLEAPGEIWAGQVFDLNYHLNVARRYYHSLGSSPPKWNAAPAMAEEWGKPEIAEAMDRGDPTVAISYHTRAYIRSPGAVTLNSTSQLLNLVTGVTSYSIFSQPSLAQYSIVSNQPEITVRPLPGGAPTSFAGAVGKFTLDSKIVPTKVTVGEPVTWTLNLSGTGNWPEISGLPARDVSRDFRAVQPQARRTIKENTLFEGNIGEDVVLIPTQPGDYTLGPVAWTFFDPDQGTYQTVTTDKVVVHVSAPPLQTPSPTPPNPTANANGTNSAVQNLPTPVAPTLPAPIPRDALGGSGHAASPWRAWTFVAALVSPLPFFFIAWLALAWQRARKTDPALPQRNAKRELIKIADEIGATKDIGRRESLLEAWQRNTALLWQLRSAVPTPDELAAATGNDAAWDRLWLEADRALYRAPSDLPADWPARARTAAEAKSVPGFSAGQLFLARNMLPFAAALILVFVSTPSLHADAGLDAYQSGKFTDAEAAWRNAVAVDNNDWIAQHNLSLALAQQNRWGEAAAHAAAAFVQHPQDAATRWELKLTSERAGFLPGSLADFLQPSPVDSLAACCAPSVWQRILVATVAVIVLAGILVLLASYRVTGAWTRVVAWVLFGLALVSAATAAIGLSRYEEAANPRAVIAWKSTLLYSIPTEADTTQKTSALGAGTIAVVQKNYLGWVQVAFSNGQTGWVRKDDLVKLWAD